MEPLKQFDSPVFRLLCPADKTGKVIGKSGSIISTIRSETRSRIRIDDAVPGCDDRIILISADPNNSNSNPQMALVRVFERIGGSSEEGKEVVCRMLVSVSEVGFVLERIGGESGAKVRVFGKDQFPACVGGGDEIVHITGSSSVVRKALFSVYSCLQDYYKTESANFSNTKSFVPTLYGSTPSGHVNLSHAQGSCLPDPHGQDIHPRTYSSYQGTDITASAHKNIVEDDVVFRMLCSNDRVGSLIGKAGTIVRALQNETGASIRVLDSVGNSDERIIVICARENSEMKGSNAQDAVLRVHSRLVEGFEKGSPLPARLLVPAQQIGCLLGKGGSIISEMRRLTGANIWVFSKDQVQKCAQPNDEVVQITGSIQSVQDALFYITSRIRESIFSNKSYANASMTQFMPDIRLSRSIVSIERQTPRSLGMDRLGVDRGPFSYSSETTGLCSFDHSPSPRSWGFQPQKKCSGNAQGFLDRGLSSGLPGSDGAPQTPIVTSISVEVIVPHHLLGFVHGDDDSNLILIREISGAKMTVYDPKHGAFEGTVVISGNPDQTRAAQSLLHGFILHGQSST